jgi:hypothetical protein
VVDFRLVRNDLIDSISIHISKTLHRTRNLPRKKKDPAQDRVFSLIEENLAMAMMTVVAAMVGRCICRND